MIWVFLICLYFSRESESVWWWVKYSVQYLQTWTCFKLLINFKVTNTTFFQTSIVLLNRTLGTHTSVSPDPAKKAALLCFSTPQLNTKQREICRKHPTLMTSVAKGAKGAVEECQMQFERRRWNCSAVPESGTLFDSILKRGKTFCHWATWAESLSKLTRIRSVYFTL